MSYFYEIKGHGELSYSKAMRKYVFPRDQILEVTSIYLLVGQGFSSVF